MNYRRQDEFFGRYRAAACALCALLGLLGGAVGWRTSAGPGELAAAALVVAATCYAAVYLPLYFELSVEAHKRVVWLLRMNWIAAGALLLGSIPAVSVGAHVPFLAAGGLLVLAGAGARRLARRRPQAPASAGLLLGAADVAGLAWFLMTGSLRGALAVALAALVGVVTTLAQHSAGRWVVAAGLLAAVPVWLLEHAGGDAGGGLSIAAFGYCVAAVTGSACLARFAAAHHASQTDATTRELSAFARVPAHEAQELLATSTGILARSWNDDPPTAPADVERWYEENSRYYLYDLAQFHLAYKHVAFMRDVVSMCRGRVLDHGGGIGDVALELARRGHDVTYLDVDGQTKAFARWKAEREGLGLEFASALDAVRGPYDTVVSLDVLEHLPDPEPVVDRLVELLAPGGRFVVTAYFGPTKAHPMHFDHELDLARHLEGRGLRSAKTFAMRWLRSEFLRKRGVLVYEKP